MGIPERSAWRRTAVNAALGTVFAGVLAGTALQISSEGRDWVLDAGAGVLVCGAALLRRRHWEWAIAVGLAGSALAALLARFAGLPREPGAAVTLALLVLTASAVRVLPWRRAACVAAGVVVLPLGWLTPQSSQTSHLQLAAGIVGWCAALSVGLGLRLLDERRRAAIDGVRRDERVALARELHDVVAHHMTGVVIQAQAARIVARKRPEDLQERLTAIETAGTDALSALRRVVGLLRDADDGASTAPGPEELAELARRFQGHGPDVRLNLPTSDGSMPQEVTTTIYRVVQESLTNIARHAPHAVTATVDIAHDQHGVTIDITDDATPTVHRHPHRSGFGLLGMQERVEALGGTFSAGPRPGAGWGVHATLPVSPGDR